MGLSDYWLVPLRAVQLLIALIVLGIAGSLVASNAHLASSIHSSAGYAVFVAVWTLVASTYLLVAGFFFVESYALVHPFLVGALEIFSWVFWLAVWAAMAAGVNADGCRGHNSWLCGRQNAVLAFGIIEWLLFCASTGYASYQLWSEIQERNAAIPSMSTTKPEISQIGTAV